MNEAVDRVLEEREAMDRGFPAGIVMSGVVHVLFVGGAFAASWLAPRPPEFRVMPGFVERIPRGGGAELGPDPAPAPAAPPATTPAAPVEAPPAPAPPPPVLKPPKAEPRRGLPPPDAKKSKPERPAPRHAERPDTSRTPAPSSGTSGTGANVVPGGVGIIGPAGGSPNGNDDAGDWYLAGVQRKIWMIWMRQIKANFTQPITISFTILADGSLEDGSVRPVQGSGVQLLDLAAQRAVLSAAPFGPLPKTYGTNRVTIQALFQPTP